jgi:hypothetical protein
MTPTPVPDAAVQIAAETLRLNSVSIGTPEDFAHVVVDALASAGWLHDPDEVERLRAEVAALRLVVAAAVEVDEILHRDDQIWSNAEAAETLGQRLLDARVLDAAPAGQTTAGGREVTIPEGARALIGGERFGQPERVLIYRGGQWRDAVLAVETCPNPDPCGRPDVCRFTCGPDAAAETGIT